MNSIINKLKARFGWENQNDIAKALNIHPSGISARKRRGTLIDAIKLWAAENGHDISDILRNEECQAQTYGNAKSSGKLCEDGKNYDPHGGWKPHPMPEDWTLVGKMLAVIKSGTVYGEALKKNIEAFHKAVMDEAGSQSSKGPPRDEPGEQPPPDSPAKQRASGE